MEQWDADLHARIARAIKTHRAGRSAQDVSDRTAELGYRVSRAQIANYESGRKKNLDVAELLILAAALDVPPLVLIYPDLPDGMVEVIPKNFGRSFNAWSWACGFERSPQWDWATGNSRGYQLMEVVLARRNKMGSLVRAHMNLSTDQELDPVTKESVRQAADTLKAQVAGLTERIRELGGKVDDV